MNKFTASLITLLCDSKSLSKAYLYYDISKNIFKICENFFLELMYVRTKVRVTHISFKL